MADQLECESFCPEHRDCEGSGELPQYARLLDNDWLCHCGNFIRTVSHYAVGLCDLKFGTKVGGGRGKDDFLIFPLVIFRIIHNF